MIFFVKLLIPMAITKKSVSTSTYNDVIIKPKRNGKVSLVINHEYAGEMAKMHEKNFKNMGIVSSAISPTMKMNSARLKFKKSKAVPIK